MKVHRISLLCSLHNLVKVAHCLIYFKGYKKFGAATASKKTGKKHKSACKVDRRKDKVEDDDDFLDEYLNY